MHSKKRNVERKTLSIRKNTNLLEIQFPLIQFIGVKKSEEALKGTVPGMFLKCQLSTWLLCFMYVPLLIRFDFEALSYLVTKYVLILITDNAVDCNIAT